MAAARRNEFQLPPRQLRAELLALSVMISAAALVGVLDLGVEASASEAAMLEEAVPSALDAKAALNSAAEQGVSGSLISESPVYSFEWDRQVWRVAGEQTATIDARTGELLEVGF